MSAALPDKLPYPSAEIGRLYIEKALYWKKGLTRAQWASCSVKRCCCCQAKGLLLGLSTDAD